MNLLSIGMFVFALDSAAHDELQRRIDFRFARNARVGARDGLQAVGREDTLSLSGTQWAELSGGRASLERLVQMADQRRAWPVVDGAGFVYGNFVVTGIDQRYKHLLDDGTPLRIDFAVDLVRTDDAASG